MTFLTKCECTNAIYYQQEHNGYDLLKESRSYHAKEANDDLEKSSTSRNYELYSKMLKLDVRDEFGDQVLAAWTAQDENEMLKVNLEPPTKKQSSFAYFYRYNYTEIDKQVNGKNPERQARDVTNKLFLLWNSLRKEECTDSASDEI